MVSRVTWKLADDVPLIQCSYCPIDNCELTCLARAGKARIGGCPHCGHITYIDRPPEEWWEKFYQSEWDSAKAKRKSAGSTAAGIITSHVPTNSSVLDFGCGYGNDLDALAKAGFWRLTGVEVSQHRREAVVDWPVYESICDAPGSYDFVFTSHTLEHVYNPLFIAHRFRRLQPVGGKLLIIVPDQDAEPTENIVSFLPHLHSFTKVSLIKMAMTAGYDLLWHQKGPKGEQQALFQVPDFPAHRRLKDFPELMVK